jgi:hypothetical protein
MKDLYEKGDLVVFKGTFFEEDQEFNDLHFVVGDVYTVKHSTGDGVMTTGYSLLYYEEIERFNASTSLDDCL